MTTATEARSAPARRAHLSFEFFPPKTAEGKARLLEAHAALAALEPDFVSVTYGAGGSTRERTREIVVALAAEGAEVAPHLSFGGDDAGTVAELLESYRAAGIRRLVALRGDAPSGLGSVPQLVHASELVGLVRERTGDHFSIAVAAYPETHPESPDAATDVRFLRLKFEAGADFAITQFFYNADAYFRFLELCAAEGIDRPVCPGIMPITDHRGLERFARNCGAEIPRWLHYRLESLAHDPEGLRAFAAEFVGDLCRRLLDGGAPGLHLYAMNQSQPSLEVLRHAGLH